MPEFTRTVQTTKPDSAPAEKAGKPKKANARDMVREAGKVKKAKAKKEKPPREEQVVFAFRFSESDRATIHTAAGPAKATKFVRAAALAAANADHKAFDALVTQAKANLK